MGGGKSRMQIKVPLTALLLGLLSYALTVLVLSGFVKPASSRFATWMSGAIALFDLWSAFALVLCAGVCVFIAISASAKKRKVVPQS